MTAERASRIVGEHRVYALADKAVAVAYVGDVTPADSVALTAAVDELTDNLLAIVIDVSRLGSYDARARKAMRESKIDELLADEEADVLVCLVGADVLRRALIMLAVAVGRVLTKRHIRVRTFQELAAAEATAVAYCEEVARRSSP